MTLTKDQRFTAYCILLVEAEIRDNQNYGLCYLTRYLNENIEFNRSDDEIDLYDHLPELYRRRPSKRVYWFARTKAGWQKRIELLKQCIEETA